jgi:hypothetical protein
MAEKRFAKGLFKDTAHIDQPEGSWRYARNMLLNSTDGAVSNEGGTELSGHLGTDDTVGAQNDKVIGAIEVDKDRVVLFILNVVSLTPRSEIGIWENGSYTILYNPTLSPTVDLNFKETNPIEGTFKIDSKGDLIIYWTDDLNPPRAFNVDRQLRDSTGISNLYGIPSLTSINLLNLFPYSGKVPTIKLGEVLSASPIFQTAVHTGGGLKTGVYHLALAYVDKDNVATAYVSISSPVSLVAELDSTRPTTKKDGDKEGTQTAKAVSWQVSDVNLDYKYLRPVVIRKMGDATEAYRLNDIQIDLNSSGYMIINFSGIEGVIPASVEDVIIDTVSYDTAKTINQLDGVLYLGNLTGSQDVGFQKYANNIKLRSKLYKIDKFDEYWATADGLHTGFGNSPVDEGNSVLEDRSYRYVPNISNYRGYQRDEVYAFYIAFIMKDGSMSYAYHIPGREAITSGVTYTSEYLSPGAATSEVDGISSTLKEVYAKTAKMYQFYDTTIVMPNSATRVMQYWENQNEFYPQNEDYEVWDASDTKIGDVHGLNVRHHHFPSNENTDRSSVSSNDDSVVSASLHAFANYAAIATSHYQGTFYAGFGSDHTGTASWAACNTGAIYANSGSLTPAFAGASSTFTATTDNTTVRVSPLMRVHVSGSGGHHGAIRLQRFDSAAGTWSTQNGTNCSGANNSYWSSNSNFRTENTNEERVLHGIGHAWAWVINLNAGDAVRLQIYGSDSDVTFKGQCGDDADDNCPTPAGSACNGGSWPVMWSNSSTTGSQWPYDNTCSHIRVNVSINTNPINLADYRDVKISQEARALGFRLSDIHIPQTIADKVQGFRIFRANRDHSDRTILGQSVGIPMMPQFGIIGLCNESSGNADAMQNLAVESGREDFFLNKTPWAEDISVYPNGYGAISFHDFYLLRTKNSLAPATHLKLEYKVRDYVWNGPDIEQAKKMLTEIDTSTPNSTTGAYEVKERWGWDSPSNANANCYPQYANSAIFIGGRYLPVDQSSIELNRALGQKAKSYVRGDSVFGAEALGFGGKICNLGGESHIALGLRDTFGIPPLISNPDLDGSGIGSGNIFNVFGLNRPDAGPMLVGGPSGIGGGNRHESYVMNLKAYKTDVYKSIDSNDLVFTGFEVKGKDLNNFIIGGTYNSSSADFTTDTVQSNPTSVLYHDSDNKRGIFGGDIFLARYGFASSLSPLNTEQLSNPRKAIYSHIVESSDNIALRHSESKESDYFPNTPAREILKMAGTEKGDFTHQDNLKYNKNYSTPNDIKPAFPLPVSEGEQTNFPTRTHRSAKNDTTSLIDNYRIFLANQFKDLPKNRGELWKLSSFNNLLYFHMEESLFAAKGKQSMSMKDGSEAFVGSGDIFQQDPDEVVQTEDGFGGTQSQWASLTTRFGYFFIDRLSRKVFLMKESLSEISNLGLSTWFELNLGYALEAYGFNPACGDDNPIIGFGLTSIWDPKHKRIILTKRDVEPTADFITGWNMTHTSPPTLGEINFNTTTCKYTVYVGCHGSWPCPDMLEEIEWNNSKYFTKGGWTISYYPELGVWGSFHDYTPYIYFNTSTDFYSLTDKYPRPCAISVDGTNMGNAGIWKHNADRKGLLYQANSVSLLNLGIVILHPFEFEFIHNETKGVDTLTSAFNYTAEVFNSAGVNVLEHGFTKFFLYNTFQVSADNINLDGITGEGTDLQYLVNTRRVGNNWKINHFRDMAAVAVDTSSYYMQGTVTNPNIIGGSNVGTITTSSTQSMFTVDGMSKNINAGYLDLAKSWDKKRKFIDKWVGIRLIYDNISNNLLNLYSTNVVVRKMHR